jgi:hypothetical protein
MIEESDLVCLTSRNTVSGWGVIPAEARLCAMLSTDKELINAAMSR